MVIKSRASKKSMEFSLLLIPILILFCFFHPESVVFLSAALLALIILFKIETIQLKFKLPGNFKGGSGKYKPRLPGTFRGVPGKYKPKLKISRKFKLENISTKEIMAIIAIPMGVGTTLLANKIILLIFGSQYTPSVVALQILIWSSVIIFLSGAFTILVQTSNKQMVVTQITAVNVVLNVVLNLILIPHFSYIAASVVTVVTELSAFLLGLRVVSNMGYGLTRKDLSYLIKAVLASGVMALFIAYFNNMRFSLKSPSPTTVNFTFSTPSSLTSLSTALRMC